MSFRLRPQAEADIEALTLYIVERNLRAPSVFWRWGFGLGKRKASPSHVVDTAVVLLCCVS